MPPADLHRKKRRKNLALLGLILAWCALIWLVTMAKMARSQDMPPSGAFIEQRQEHQAAMDEAAGRWRKIWDSRAEERARRRKAMDARRVAHQRKMDSTSAPLQDEPQDAPQDAQ